VADAGKVVLDVDVLDVDVLDVDVLKDGVLEDGVPAEDGVLEDGVLEDGVPEDGVLEDGVLEDGVLEDGVPAVDGADGAVLDVLALPCPAPVGAVAVEEELAAVVVVEVLEVVPVPFPGDPGGPVPVERGLVALVLGGCVVVVGDGAEVEVSETLEMVGGSGADGRLVGLHPESPSNSTGPAATADPHTRRRRRLGALLTLVTRRPGSRRGAVGHGRQARPAGPQRPGSQHRATQHGHETHGCDRAEGFPQDSDAEDDGHSWVHVGDDGGPHGANLGDEGEKQGEGDGGTDDHEGGHGGQGRDRQPVLRALQHG